MTDLQPETDYILALIEEHLSTGLGCRCGRWQLDTKRRPVDPRAQHRAHVAEVLAERFAEPQVMTSSHDRVILRRAEQSGGRVVVVRCPHTVGLSFELDEPEGFLGMLPCPCNDVSEVVARVVPVEQSDSPTERDQRVAAEAIEALAVEAESWPDDSGDDSGGALAHWLRSRIRPGSERGDGS